MKIKMCGNAKLVSIFRPFCLCQSEDKLLTQTMSLKLYELYNGVINIKCDTCYSEISSLLRSCFYFKYA